MLLDPIGAGVQAVLGAIRIHKTNEWAKLIVSEIFTYGWSFSVSAALPLFAGKGFTYAIATGLLAGASASYIVWLKSPLTKGTTVEVPTDLSNENLDLKEVKK